jgi:hypothetical protein
VRQLGRKNLEQPNAIPTTTVETEEQGNQLIVLVASRGYGEMSGRYVLTGFYDPGADMVGRIFEAGRFLASIRDWMLSDHPRDPPPRNPWSTNGLF